MKRLLIGLCLALIASGAFAQQIVTGGGAASVLVAPNSVGTGLTSVQIGYSNGSGGGSGSGILGIGAASQAGVGLNVTLPTANLVGPNQEQWALGGVVANNPSSAAGSQTNMFGAVVNSSWGGSANSGANGLNEGGQFYAYHATGSTSSLATMIGTEDAVIDLATSGTVSTEDGLDASVQNTGGGTSSNANGLQAWVTCSTPANCTNSNGVHIKNIAGGNATGLRIDDQTQGSAKAIQTGQGTVNFNDITTIGDSSTRPAELIVLGTSGQSQNLLDLKNNGSSVFTIANSGSPTFHTDVNFGTNTFITTSGTQTTRINNFAIYQNNASGLVWSSTTAASGSADVGLCRGSAGVVDVSNGALCSSPNASGSIAATNETLTGYSRLGTTTFANLGTWDASPAVGDQGVITDASACTANTAVSAGGGSTHSCPVTYNGSNWIAMVTH